MSESNIGHLEVRLEHTNEDCGIYTSMQELEKMTHSWPRELRPLVFQNLNIGAQGYNFLLNSKLGPGAEMIYIKILPPFRLALSSETASSARMSVQ